MKIIHYSYHVGCINDATYIFNKLGHEITFRHLNFPNYCVTDAIANDFWSKNESEFQTYDIVLTTDTVALSYIFMRRIDQLRPHLLIWICNRFDYAMWNNPAFYEAMRSLESYRHKVTFIPWTDYELLWCGKHKVHVSENTISSVGRMPDSVYTSPRVENDFGGQKLEYKTAEAADTVFIQKYLNHTHFMNLPEYLHSKGISIVWGGYTHFKEIQPFKGTVVFPDSFCKVFAFESIQQGLLVYLPTKRFLVELAQQSKYWFNVTAFMQHTNQLTDDLVNFCEWYKYPETRIYFDSLEDMVLKIKGTTPAIIAEKKRWMQLCGEQIAQKSLGSWRGILDKVQRHTDTAATIAATYLAEFPELAAFKSFRKIIVWGYPLGTHTHSYIHGAWVKAALALGLPVAWYHDGDFPKDADWNNCCFITEGWADKNIPIVASSTYFVHIAPNPARYLDAGARLIEIRHNVDSINDFNYLYTRPAAAVAVSPDSLYEVVPDDRAVAIKRGRPIRTGPYEAIYMYWATDLLPHEFAYEDAAMSREKTMYHIGTLDGGHALKNIAPIAAAAGVSFVHKNPWQTPVSYAENIRLMKASYTCPDYRNYVGIDSERVGYIPCRVFKAISYGHSGITNSVHAKALLGEHAEYVDSLAAIFRVTEARKDDVAWRQAAMRHVASRHTFIHRLRDLASVLNKRRTVLVIAETEWSVGQVYRGVEKSMDQFYHFKYHNARSFSIDNFLKDFQKTDFCLTSMNFYFDMMSIFKNAVDRKKIAIVAHGDSDCWGMPAAGTVCSDFTYSITSRILSDKFRERLGQPMIVTPNGVDPSLFPYRERDGSIKTIGWCGEEKLKVKRIEMAKAIAAACGHELKIATAVPRHEMSAWYNSIDLLLVTSGPQIIDETGPLPAFEAIVSGVPVIGSACGNFSFLPGPKFATVEEGTAILMSLLADPTQVKQIAAEQRACVLKDWTYKAHAPAWRSLFEAVKEKGLLI